MNSNDNQAAPTPLKPRPYDLAPLPPNLYYVEPEDPSLAADGGVHIVENSDPYDVYQYQAKSIIFAGRTPYQSIVIADTYSYGRALFLDGSIQSAHDDEALYHEMLVQPAMLFHDEPRDVLILGGGEGATLREVLAHATVRRATMVDIDGEVVELCRQHLAHWHRGAFDDARANIVIGDGRAFVERDTALYDVVIVDVVDLLDNGPAQALYTRQFYELLRERLRPSGILVVQGLEFTFLDDKAHAALARTLRTVFPQVHSYKTAVPSFLSTWGFLIASDNIDPLKWTAESIDRRILARLGTQWMDHVDGEFLLSTFVHCRETKFMLSLPGPILEDGVEFVAPPDIEEFEAEVLRLPVDPVNP